MKCASREIPGIYSQGDLHCNFHMTTLTVASIMQRDQLEIAEALHKQNYDAQPRTLLNVSLRLAVSDPISLVDTRGALFAAVQHAMQHCPYEKVVDQLMIVDSRLANQLTELMKGDGGESSSRAQVQELLQAMDKASI